VSFELWGIAAPLCHSICRLGLATPLYRSTRSCSTLTLVISKPDKTLFCFSVYSLSHNILLVIYSENKDFSGYILLEKHFRSLGISVNLFERMEAREKLIIPFQSFYSVSVENYSIQKVIPHVKRRAKVFQAMIFGARLCHDII
jgi:hypothetical protein